MISRYDLKKNEQVLVERPSTDNSSSSEPKTASPLEEIITVDYFEMWENYSNNMYGDKLIRITGQLVNRLISNEPSEYLYFKVSATEFIMLGQKWSDFRDLTEGDYITVVGKLKSKYPSYIELENTMIEPATDEEIEMISVNAEQRYERLIAIRKATVGAFEVEVIRARFAKDYSGNRCVIFTYNFTNNSDSSAAFWLTISDKLFQNGIELSNPLIISGIDYDEKTREIQSGITYAVNIAYILNDESDIEIVLDKYYALDETEQKKLLFPYSDIEI